MLRLLAVPALVAAAGCQAFTTAPADAPLCPADRATVYIEAGGHADCRLGPGQRWGVAMEHSDGTDYALLTVCLQAWGGYNFVPAGTDEYAFCLMPWGWDG